MAESPAFRTGYMSLLLPSSTGDLQVRSSIRNMVIDALAATGEWPIRIDVVTSTGSDDGQTKRCFSRCLGGGPNLLAAPIPTVTS